MGFSWEFEIEDKLTDRALKMDKALERLEKVSQKLEGALGHLDKTTESTGKGFGDFALHLDAVVNLGMKAFDVARGLGEAVYSVGESFAHAAIESASFKETTQVSLSTILGSAEAGERVLHRLVGLAGKLPLETGQTLQAGTSLLLAGFKEKQLEPLLLGMSDVVAFNPGRADAGDVFIRQIREIKSAGLRAEQLMDLSRETSIPKDKILGHLADIYGRPVEEIEKNLKNISGEAAIEAILQAIGEPQGGTLGNISNKLSTTISGLFSTLASRKLELFMDLDSSPAYGSFRGFLSNLVTLTDTTSPFGKKLKGEIAETFGHAFGGAFDSLSGATGMEKIERIATGALHAIHNAVGLGRAAFAGLEGFGQGVLGSMQLGSMSDFFTKDFSEAQVKKLSESFAELGKSLGDAVGGLIDFGKEAKPLFEQIKQLMDLVSGKRSFWSVLKENATADHGAALHRSFESIPAILATGGVSYLTSVGQRAVEGLVGGLDSGNSAVADAGAGLIDSAEQGAREQGEIHSPSRLFARLGGHIADGFAGGIEDGTPDAHAAAAGLISVPTPGALGMGGGANVTLHLNIDARGRADASEIADMARSAALEGVAQAFEQLGLEVGAVH